MTPGTSIIFELLMTIGDWLFDVLHEFDNELRKSSTVYGWVERVLLNVSWFFLDWILTDDGSLMLVWLWLSLLLRVFLGADWHLTGIKRSEWSCLYVLSIIFLIR